MFEEFYSKLELTLTKKEKLEYDKFKAYYEWISNDNNKKIEELEIEDLEGNKKIIELSRKNIEECIQVIVNSYILSFYKEYLESTYEAKFEEIFEIYKKQLDDYKKFDAFEKNTKRFEKIFLFETRDIFDVLVDEDFNINDNTSYFIITLLEALSDDPSGHEIMKKICFKLLKNNEINIKLKKEIYYYLAKYYRAKSTDDIKDSKSFEKSIIYFEKAIKLRCEDVYSCYNYLFELYLISKNYEKIDEHIILISKCFPINIELIVLSSLYQMKKFFIQGYTDAVKDIYTKKVEPILQDLNNNNNNNEIINNDLFTCIELMIVIKREITFIDENLNIFRDSQKKVKLIYYNYILTLDKYINGEKEKLSELREIYEQLKKHEKDFKLFSRQLKLDILFLLSNHLIYIVDESDICGFIENLHDLVKNDELSVEGFLSYYCNNRLYEISNNLKTKNLDKAKINEILKKYHNMIKKIELFKNSLVVKETELNKYAHYTGLGTLDILIKDDSYIRLTNASKMNDPEEGRVFLNANPKINKGFSKKIENEFKNAFLMSFCGNVDDLTLFRLYSNQSSGCSIQFKGDFFSQSIVDKINVFSLEKLKEYYYNKDYSNDTPTLYKVVYIDIDNKNAISNLCNSEIQQYNDLVKAIEDLIEYDVDGNITDYLVKDLNLIRYLFKYECWSTEKEARLVISSNSENIMNEGKVLFVNSMKNYIVESIVLGSKVEKVDILKQYYLQKDIKEVKKTKHLEV